MARIKYYNSATETWEYADISIESLSDLQSKIIDDEGNYFTTDTVEAALQQLGAATNGLEDAINAIRGVSA